MLMDDSLIKAILGFLWILVIWYILWIKDHDDK